MSIRLDGFNVQTSVQLNTLSVGNEVSVDEVGVDGETKHLDDLSVQTDVQLNELSASDGVSIGAVGVGVQQRYVNGGELLEFDGEYNAETNKVATQSTVKAVEDKIPTKVSELENDIGYVTCTYNKTNEEITLSGLKIIEQ